MKSLHRIFVLPTHSACLLNSDSLQLKVPSSFSPFATDRTFQRFKEVAQGRRVVRPRECGPEEYGNARDSYCLRYLQAPLAYVCAGLHVLRTQRDVPALPILRSLYSSLPGWEAATRRGITIEHIALRIPREEVNTYIRFSSSSTRLIDHFPLFIYPLLHSATCREERG